MLLMRLVVVALIACLHCGCGTISSVSMSSWNSRTFDQFMTYARDGDIAKCRSMLAEDQTTNEGSYPVILDIDALQIAARDPTRIRREPQSFLDYVHGRQRYSAQFASFNNHSISVEWGRIRLGSSFWIYIPPGPEFSLKQRSRETDDERQSEQIDKVEE